MGRASTTRQADFAHPSAVCAAVQASTRQKTKRAFSKSQILSGEDVMPSDYGSFAGNATADRIQLSTTSAGIG